MLYIHTFYFIFIPIVLHRLIFFFFQAEDGIRDWSVTGVQTCALPISQTNVLLAVFNMIPIPPLDGGNVLGGLLPERLAYQYDSLIRPYGFILLYALMLDRKRVV